MVVFVAFSYLDRFLTIHHSASTTIQMIRIYHHISNEGDRFVKHNDVSRCLNMMRLRPGWKRSTAGLTVVPLLGEIAAILHSRPGSGYL